jgi:alpha 1,2-mannosyltransferase
MFRTGRPGRLRTLLVALFLISAIFFFLSRWRFYNATPEPVVDFGGFPVDNRSVESHTEFWQSFQPLLEVNSPNCDPPSRGTAAGASGFNPTNPEPRPDFLFMPDEDIEEMQNAHTNFVEQIRSNPPKLHYTPGTRGLVSTAGGPYLPVLVISLRMLRRTGSQLPMEVFLASPDEYESFICEIVLRALNARCVILSEILESVPSMLAISHYQFKPFAMLFSSFEEILFLDADAFPLHDPETLFTTEPFQSRNLVTWPDFWGSSASPLYYTISSQEIPPMSERASTESGELLISKKTHSESLLLATYYNYYGPSHYYSLFSQGAAGEGDKETFIAAATVLGQPFYQVSERICAIGHGKAEGGMAGSGMVQFDPLEDFTLTQKGIWRVKDDKAPAPRAFFIHANYPKFNPGSVFNGGDVDPTHYSDGSFTRAWTIPEDVIKGFGEDIEKQFWKEIMWVGCELEEKFNDWLDKENICKNVRRYWKQIFE